LGRQVVRQLRDRRVGLRLMPIGRLPLAAVDGFVARYNTDRPHQALDERTPVMPADRFRPAPQDEQELLELWLPPHLAPAEPSDYEIVTDDA